MNEGKEARKKEWKQESTHEKMNGNTKVLMNQEGTEERKQAQKKKWKHENHA